MAAARAGHDWRMVGPGHAACQLASLKALPYTGGLAVRDMGVPMG
jgi:hypothetical protein